MRRTMMCLWTALISVPALGQFDATYLLVSSNTVTPSSPTTTIEIWAMWDDLFNEFMFGAANYDLTAGDGVFSNPVNVLNGPGSSTGVISGNVITGGVNLQFWPGPFGNPNRDNPILLAAYDWTTSDFSPRAVDLQTSNTSVFNVADLNTGGIVELYPHEFSPGSGVINVVPAPAAWVVLALPLVAAARRRRL